MTPYVSPNATSITGLLGEIQSTFTDFVGSQNSHLHFAPHILRLISKELTNVSGPYVELSWSSPVVVNAEVARSQEATIHVICQRSKIPDRIRYQAIKATSRKMLVYRIAHIDSSLASVYHLQAVKFG